MALSLATDLGSGLPLEDALQSCLLSIELGSRLGLSDAELHKTYYLALLRYIGCTADAHRFAALLGDEQAFADQFAAQFGVGALDPAHPAAMIRFLWGQLAPGRWPLTRVSLLAQALPMWQAKARAHCDVAQQMAGRLGFDSALTAALGQVFERWDGHGLPQQVKGEALAPAVRVLHVAQDAVIFHRAAGVDSAVALLRQRAGSAYDPRVVEALCQDAPRLLGRLTAGSTWTAVLDTEPGLRPYLTDEQLELAARAMADFADLKSPYMANHSSGVADLASRAAQGCGAPAAEVTALRRAGLLHDLGRVGVSAAIWDKREPLTESEWERLRLHPYYTERILARPASLAKLGTLAAMNHERLDGSGYHRGLPAALQPASARILAAADVYHALTEPRPHRPGRPPEQAAAELRHEAQAGRIDADAAHAVLSAAGHRVSPVRRGRVAGLTEREVMVLGLVARGLSNRQIGQQLSVSRKTVDNHLQNIYSKINVTTRAGAAFFAMQHDLVSDPP